MNLHCSRKIQQVNMSFQMRYKEYEMLCKCKESLWQLSIICWNKWYVTSVEFSRKPFNVIYIDIYVLIMFICLLTLHLLDLFCCLVFGILYLTDRMVPSALSLHDFLRPKEQSSFHGLYVPALKNARDKPYVIGRILKVVPQHSHCLDFNQ